MEEDLRQLFLDKGLAEDVVASMQDSDDSLRTVDDLASGATSESDARSWAEELGLSGRVPKSRFVQCWLEARSRLHKSIQISTDQQASQESSKPPPPTTTTAAPAQPALEAPKVEEVSDEAIQASTCLDGHGNAAAADEQAVAMALLASLQSMQAKLQAMEGDTDGPHDKLKDELVRMKQELKDRTLAPAPRSGAFSAAAASRQADLSTGGAALQDEADLQQPGNGRRISFSPPAAGDAAAGDAKIAFHPERDLVARPLFESRRSDPVHGGDRPDRDGHGLRATPSSPGSQSSQASQGYPGASSTPFKSAYSAPHMPHARGSAEEFLTRSAQLDNRKEVIVPRPGQEETFPKPGGFSSELVKLLRAMGLTFLEVRDLEANLDPDVRSCQSLAKAVHSEEEAMRLAESVGIRSKVSKEYFAEAWRKCADAGDGRRKSFTSVGGFEALSLHGPKDWPLYTMMARNDWDGCAKLLLRGSNLMQEEELTHILAKLLARLAVINQVAMKKEAMGSDKVSAVLAKTYGEDVAEMFGRNAMVEQAEWRWRWTLSTMFSERTAIALQKRLLQDYKSVSFQVASYQLNKDWQDRADKPKLEEKMAEIQALCFDKVLSKVLPCYGFSPDAAGVAEMKACVSKHAKLHAEARQLQVEISAAVMEGFTL